jgi:hypothetical protein
VLYSLLIAWMRAISVPRSERASEASASVCFEEGERIDFKILGQPSTTLHSDGGGSLFARASRSAHRAQTSPGNASQLVVDVIDQPAAREFVSLAPRHQHYRDAGLLGQGQVLHRTGPLPRWGRPSATTVPKTVPA